MDEGRMRKGPLAALFGLFAVAIGSFWWGSAPPPPPAAPPSAPIARPDTVPPADGPPLVLVLRTPDFANTEVRRDGGVTVTGQGDVGTRVALIQNNVAVVEQPTGADGRYTVTSPQLARPAPSSTACGPRRRTGARSCRRTCSRSSCRARRRKPSPRR